MGIHLHILGNAGKFRAFLYNLYNLSSRKISKREEVSSIPVDILEIPELRTNEAVVENDIVVEDLEWINIY